MPIRHSGQGHSYQQKAFLGIFFVIFSTPYFYGVRPGVIVYKIIVIANR